MSGSSTARGDPTSHATQRLIDVAAQLPPGAFDALISEFCDLVGARTARLYVADYSLRRLQQINDRGRVGTPQPITGTLLGRAFTGGEVLIIPSVGLTVFVPLRDGTAGIGLLELEYDNAQDEPSELLAVLTAVFVLLLASSGRYTDRWARARRSEALSPAAEIQWDLLPPLSCTTPDVGVGGILEPAYDIGGDSFDYAVNERTLDFAIVDATGHGMPAVLMAGTAVNGLRHARRAGLGLVETYERVDSLVARQFGNCYYVTGQVGTLDFRTGILTWINAGHVLPLLVRNGTYVGELSCRPSMPFGLSGPVVEVAAEPLQRGDRVLFYTDGFTESKSPDGKFFGKDRLVDFLVRATLERVPVAETARLLSSNVVDYVGDGLKDDATLLLLELMGATN